MIDVASKLDPFQNVSNERVSDIDNSDNFADKLNSDMIDQFKVDLMIHIRIDFTHLQS